MKKKVRIKKNPKFLSFSFARQKFHLLSRASCYFFFRFPWLRFLISLSSGYSASSTKMIVDPTQNCKVNMHRTGRWLTHETLLRWWRSRVHSHLLCHACNEFSREGSCNTTLSLSLSFDCAFNIQENFSCTFFFIRHANNSSATEKPKENKNEFLVWMHWEKRTFCSSLPKMSSIYRVDCDQGVKDPNSSPEHQWDNNKSRLLQCWF